MVCAPPGATTVSGETQRRNASTAVAAAEAAGSGRGGWPYAALEDANLDLALAHNAHKFHVGLLRKIAMHANLRADGLPGFAGNGEFRIFDQDDKVRIAGGDFNADNLGASR